MSGEGRLALRLIDLLRVHRYTIVRGQCEETLSHVSLDACLQVTSDKHGGRVIEPDAHLRLDTHYGLSNSAQVGNLPFQGKQVLGLAWDRTLVQVFFFSGHGHSEIAFFSHRLRSLFE